MIISIEEEIAWKKEKWDPPTIKNSRQAKNGKNFFNLTKPIYGKPHT